MSAQRPTAPRGLATDAPTRDDRAGRDVLASTVLACFSMVVLASFVRVFGRWDFLAATLGAAASVHLFSLVLRLLRAPSWLLVVLVPIFGGWVFALIQYPDTLNIGIPTPTTWSAIRASLDQIVAEFPTAIAPVPMNAAWLSVAVAAAVSIAAISELFAFPARAIGEALAPGAFVFVLIAALGDDDRRIPLTLAMIATGVVAVAVLGWHHDRTVLLGPRRPALVSTGPTVVAVALVVAAAAGWIGPRLPGAGAEPVIDPTTGSGRSVTTIVSPMVEIRSRLTNQSQVELFTMNSPTPAYWRSTTLPEFTGDAFRLPARELEEVDRPSSEIENPSVQKIRINALGDRTVPAAAEPKQADGVRADGSEVRLRINRDTSTLLAPDDLARGDTFTVVSSTSTFSADELRAASTTTDVDEIYLSIPDGFPSAVADLARQVTDGQPTDYDKLIALQNWFRSDFEYSLEVEEGHGTSAIEHFLDIRSGYCEQFSATFAAMARTLDMPSRVAVGFTSGERNGDEFTVRGANAHAWPEIYFDGIGWVPFEPTPGRGIPGAEEYTGVEAPQQVGSDTSTPPTTVPGTGPPSSAPSPATPSTDPRPAGNPFDQAAPTTPSDDGFAWGWWLLAVLAVAAVAVAPALARRAIRSRDQHLPPAESAIVAWRRSQRAARRAGATLAPSSTTSDWVEATASVLPVAARPMRSIGAAFDLACYAPVEQSQQLEPAELTQLANQVERISDESLTIQQRIRGWFRIH